MTATVLTAAQPTSPHAVVHHGVAISFVRQSSESVGQVSESVAQVSESASEDGQ